MSFYEAMAAGLVDVPLILSSMQHEVNGWSGSLVFHLTNIEWASYLHAYFGSWPRGTVRYTFYNTPRFQSCWPLAKMKRQMVLQHIELGPIFAWILVGKLQASCSDTCHFPLLLRSTSREASTGCTSPTRTTTHRRPTMPWCRTTA